MFSNTIRIFYVCLLQAKLLFVPITRIVNLSLSEGVFPHQFRHSIVTPLIKKPSLPRNDLKNYRPVSGLNFISKVIERVVAVIYRATLF